MTLTREGILKAKKYKIEAVDCPELGGAINVRGCTAAQKGRYEKALYTVGMNGQTKLIDHELARVRLRLCVMAICDDDGNLLYGETDQDMAEIGELPAAVVDRLFDVAQRLSGMTDTDVEELTRSVGDPLEGSRSA